MRKRIFATTTMLAVLLALFVIAPGVVGAYEGPMPIMDPLQPPAATLEPDPIILVSSVINNHNPGNETVYLALTFSNVGTDTLSNLRVTLSGFRSSEIMSADGIFTRALDPATLGPTQQGTVTFPIVVSGSFGTGSVDLGVDVQYNSTTSAFNLSTLTTATVNIVRPVPPPPPEPEPEPPPPPELPISVPRVIISRHQLSVDNVYIGQPFYLTITLLNTSRNMNVRNMEVIITDPEGIFTPVVGVNSFFIERLNAQETTDIEIQLIARQLKENVAPSLVISIAYEDSRNNPHTTSPSLNIPVFTQLRLETANINFYEDGNGSADLSFEVQNRGLAPLSNLIIRIEGDVVAMEGELFVGTFAPGAVEFFDDMMIPLAFGEVHAEIVLEFEDSAGVPGELRFPISTFISEPFFREPDFGDDDIWSGEEIWVSDEGMGTDTTINWLLWGLIGGGALLLAAIITIGIVRRVKRKKREAEDFGDD